MDILRVTHQDCTSFSTGCPTSWELLTLMLLFCIIREHSFLPLKSKDSNNHWGQQAASQAPESSKLGKKRTRTGTRKKSIRNLRKQLLFPSFSNGPSGLKLCWIGNLIHKNFTDSNSVSSKSLRSPSYYKDTSISSSNKSKWIQN